MKFGAWGRRFWGASEVKYVVGLSKATPKNKRVYCLRYGCKVQSSVRFVVVFVATSSWASISGSVRHLKLSMS